MASIAFGQRSIRKLPRKDYANNASLLPDSEASHTIEVAYSEDSDGPLPFDIASVKQYLDRRDEPLRELGPIELRSRLRISGEEAKSAYQLDARLLLGHRP